VRLFLFWAFFNGTGLVSMLPLSPSTCREQQACEYISTGNIPVALEACIGGRRRGRNSSIGSSSTPPQYPPFLSKAQPPPKIASNQEAIQGWQMRTQSALLPQRRDRVVGPNNGSGQLIRTIDVP